MPRSATTGVYTRVSNSFSQPVFGTLIDPTDADSYFDDLDVGLNPPELDGPVRIIDQLQVGTTGTAAGTVQFLNATSGSLTLSPPTGALGTVTLTLPALTDNLVSRTSTDTLTNKTLSGAIFSGALTVTSTGSSALAVGPNGATNPVLQVDASVASQATGLKITGLTTGAGATLAVIDSGSNSSLSINAKGTGAIAIGTVSTGAINLGTTGSGAVVNFFGSASGSTAIVPAAAASGTLTLPSATDTLVGKATTDTFTNKTFNSSGTGNTLQVSGVTVSRGQFPGTSTNDSATAGNIGEYVPSTIASGSAVSLTSPNVSNITSISLTAGDWDVDILGYFGPGASTNVAFATVGISTTSATLDTTEGRFAQNGAMGVPVVTFTISVPTYRLSLSGTTTVFFVARGSFTVSTLNAYGIIQARRAR